jgi:RNA polymerase sigma-70 factor (family 1)
LTALSDLELWLLVKQGDSTAFEALYNRYWEKLYAVCYWHLMDQEGAKDIVQELFVDLWAKKNQINIEETMNGYLKVATRNRIFNHIRSVTIKKKHLDKVARDYDDKGNTTDEQNRERELRRLYVDEIQKLPQKMKEVFMLNKEDGFSISEVADKLSLSEQTVKNQLSTALKRIRSGLEHYYRPLLILVGLCVSL